MLSEEDIKELAVIHFHEKGTFEVRDTGDIAVKLINTGREDQWFVAYNRVMAAPALFLYHITKPYDPPHYVPLHNKTNCIIEDVNFENVTNDDIYELVIELHFDYDLAYQGREIVILRNPFGNPAYEIFSFPFEQVWESIDSFNADYGLPSYNKRVENHAFYEFFEGYILIRGIINYRDNHLVEYKWNKQTEEFVLFLDEEFHEIDEEESTGNIIHKVKGNKRLIEVNSHEEGCIAYLLEDPQGHVIDIPKKIHDELLCSQVTALSSNGRYLIYTNNTKNAICLYDIEQNKDQSILYKFDTYEGISEVVWAPGRPKRFAFISVNQEELLENTRLHIFTFRKNDRIKQQQYDLPIHYECDLEGICVPLKDYNYKFDRNNRFTYTPDASGQFKALIIN